jgi:hypothetical protein
LILLPVPLPPAAAALLRHLRQLLLTRVLHMKAAASARANKHFQNWLLRISEDIIDQRVAIA